MIDRGLEGKFDFGELSKHACGKVDVSKFVKLIVTYDFRSPLFDDRLVEEVAEMYDHMVSDKCTGCIEGVGLLLEEYATGNPAFVRNIWKNNLAILTKFYSR